MNDDGVNGEGYGSRLPPQAPAWTKGGKLKMSEEWDSVEDGKKYRRYDGWLVVRDNNGGIHVVTPEKSDGKRRSFDSIAAAIDFVDQHHPS